MTLEDTIRQVVREELRAGLRELAPGMPAAASTSEFLKYRQAAAMVDVSVSTIKAWVEAAHLKRYGKGRNARVRRDELISFLASNEGHPPRGGQKGKQTAEDLDARAAARERKT